MRARFSFASRCSMDMKLKARRSAIGSAFLATSMLLGCESALAVKASEESHRLVRPNDVVSSLGAATFGEEINHYSGSLSFRHTDISLPGNDDLPMSVGRRYTVEGTGAYGGGASKFGGGLFGDWDIDLPVIHGTFAASGAQGVRGFKVLVVQGGPVESAVGTGESGASDARCTKFGPPPDYKGLPLSSYVIFSYFDYWHGINLYVPGAGDQEILKRSSQNTSAPGGQVSSYPLVTQSHWQFSCLPTLANGEPGEGFLARSPSGMTYRFDWLVYRQADTLSKSDSSGGVTNLDGSNINPDPWTAHLARSQALLYPTRITDRFGNAVTLNWSGSKLLSMSASDGRQLTFSYGSGTTIQSISDGSRTWSYGYSNNLLTSMTLPDLSQWTFSLFSLQKSLQFISPPVCESPGMLTSTAETSGSITHPSGATATFTIKPVTQGLSWVAYSCSTISQKGPSATYPSLSVVRKQISGPGLPLLRWDYEHGPTNHCWTGPSAPAPVCTKNSVTTKNVKITAPDGGETRLYFSNRVGDKQGKLVKTEYLDGGSIVRTDVTTYGSPAGKAFPDPVGISITDRGDTDESQRIYPSEALASTVNGRLVTHATSVWDQFGNPTSVSKSDGVTSKSELITYDNNTSLWVLGQTSSVKNVGSTTFETEVVYDAATGLPVERKSFGRTEATFGYCTAVSATCAAKGLMSWSRDGAGAQTSYQNHHRGIPQKVIFADDRFVTGTVSDRGWVTSYTDEMGRETAYDYDLMGRLKRIDYPRDIQSWDTTFVNFSKQDSAEYGVAGGHWKQSITTGRYRKETVYDALWRPVLTHEWDAQSGGNDRYTVRAFDAEGNETFASYPAGSVGTISAAVAANAGVSKIYDAIGRLRSTTVHSELGPLTTTIAYDNSYVKRITNPRGQVTRIEYLQLEAGSEALPTRIDVRDSAAATTPLVTIDIGRDVWGKPRSITRAGSNPTVSATRGYVYDVNQRLCKVIEPEYGAEIYQLDDAGRISARAKHPTLTSDSACNVANVPAAAWISHGYDPRGRLTSTDYPDNTADEWRTYHPDGALATVKRGSGAEEVLWTYDYNSRGMVMEERILIDTDQSAATTYGYDSIGGLSVMRYMNGPWVYYAPNAFGQPTEATLTIPTVPTSQVYTLANNVSYYPNGAMSGFGYGNGGWHSMTPNERGLPKRSVDQIGAVKWVDNTYGYDRNGNPTSIDDALNLDDKSLGYDALDRLTAASGGFGEATMQYDGLDRLTRYSLTGPLNSRDWRYWYDSSQRLDTVTNTQGATQVDLDHDLRGNVLSR
ncbi:MAG TPA: hypothetical protein PLB00_10030, partial [Pseudomonadota bacterium]|nr:hypothetical protein [Pseudomonadota bacterium]